MKIKWGYSFIVFKIRWLFEDVVHILVSEIFIAIKWTRSHTVLLVYLDLVTILLSGAFNLASVQNKIRIVFIADTMLDTITCQFLKIS